jgi:hypothetical protein
MGRAVTLAVNWRLAPREMEYILDHSLAKVLFVGEEFLDHVAQMKLPHVRRVIVFGHRARAGELCGLAAGAPAIDPQLPCGPGRGRASSSTPRAPRACPRAWS